MNDSRCWRFEVQSSCSFLKKLTKCTKINCNPKTKAISHNDIFFFEDEALSLRKKKIFSKVSSSCKANISFQSDFFCLPFSAKANLLITQSFCSSTFYSNHEFSLSQRGGNETLKSCFILSQSQSIAILSQRNKKTLQELEKSYLFATLPTLAKIAFQTLESSI